MKGCPDEVSGPMGPWLRKVRDRVALVRMGSGRSALIDLLGEPDEVRPDGRGPAAQLQETLEGIAGGPTLIQIGDTAEYEEILVFRDPYRPRRRYAFAFQAGVVTRRWEETTTS